MKGRLMDSIRRDFGFGNQEFSCKKFRKMMHLLTDDQIMKILGELYCTENRQCPSFLKIDLSLLVTWSSIIDSFIKTDLLEFLRGAYTFNTACCPSIFQATRNRGSLSSARSRSRAGNLEDRNFLLQIASQDVCIPANPGQKNARPF